jgi:hypothetical protein
MVAEMTKAELPNSYDNPIVSTVEVVAVHGMGMQHSSETLLDWAEPLLHRIDFYAKQAPSRSHQAQPADTTTPRVPPDVVSSQREFEPDSSAAIAEALASKGFVWKIGYAIGNRVNLRNIRYNRPGIETDASSGPEGDLAPTHTPRATTTHDDDDQVEPSTVEFTSVLIGSGTDDHVTSTVRYVKNGETPEHRVLTMNFTEARWAESFLPLTRARVFVWGMLFVFKTARRIASYLRNSIYGRARAIARPIGWLSWVAICAAVGLLYALASLTAVLLVLLGPLMVLPFFAKQLGPTIDMFLAYIGDAPAWSEHPVRAAAMRKVVQEQIVKARERAGKNGTVVVIAHSEGAAITVELLCRANPPKGTGVDVLVTVGAAVTLLGRPGWNTKVIRAQDLEKTGQSIELNYVRAWAQRKQPTKWLNFWATWDVVPSGPISTGRAARGARWTASYSNSHGVELGPEEHPVHNRSWPLEDHQTYTANVVQVIDPLARMIMSPTPSSADTLTLDDKQAAWNREHVIGVKRMAFNRLLIAIVGVLAVFSGGLYDLFEKVPLDGAASAIATAFDLNQEKWPWSWLLSHNWVFYGIGLAVVLAFLLWVNSVLQENFIDAAFQKPKFVSGRPRWRWIFTAFTCFLLAMIAVLSVLLGGPTSEWWVWAASAAGVALLTALPRLGIVPTGTPQVT